MFGDMAEAPRLNRLFLGFMLAIAALLIFSGLSLPALSVTKLYFFSSQYSLLDGMRSLYDNGDVWLAALVFAFTVVFPFFKVALGYAALLFGGAAPGLMRRSLGVLGRLSKWSMLDVFALALAVVIIDGRVLTASNVEGGLVFFVMGIFLSTIAIHRLQRLAESDGTIA